MTLTCVVYGLYMKWLSSRHDKPETINDHSQQAAIITNILARCTFLNCAVIARYLQKTDDGHRRCTAANNGLSSNITSIGSQYSCSSKGVQQTLVEPLATDADQALLQDNHRRHQKLGSTVFDLTVAQAWPLPAITERRKPHVGTQAVRKV